MAYMRQPSTDPTGSTYLRVLVDGLGTNQISSLTIHCSNGVSYAASVEGGSAGNYRSTTQTFTGLVSGQSYSFWATGSTTGGTAINVPASSFSTIYVPPPDPDPAVTSMSMTAAGTLEVTWSVSNASYLRASNSIRIYVSGANNTTQYDMGYFNSSTRSFSRALSGDGSALVVGASYTVWVFVYDADNNSFGANRSATFSRPRPVNFNWTYAKTSNSVYNLTYDEWNSFLNKINEFRAYKGLAQLNFSRNLYSGAITSQVELMASSFNSAINAINTMSPTTSTPSQVSSGQIITASALNAIRASLNSIV